MDERNMKTNGRRKSMKVKIANGMKKRDSNPMQIVPNNKTKTPVFSCLLNLTFLLLHYTMYTAKYFDILTIHFKPTLDKACTI